jgi:hypothetical protein
LASNSEKNGLKFTGIRLYYCFYSTILFYSILLFYFNSNISITVSITTITFCYYSITIVSITTFQVSSWLHIYSS